MRLLIVLSCAALLGACASVAPPSGALSGYDGLQDDPSAVRARIASRTDAAALSAVSRVRLEPTRLVSGGAWLTEQEQAGILREIDAQLCFELSERYEIAGSDGPAHVARAVVSGVEPTGQAGSAVSAASSFFIPGPIGLRTPTGRGGLSAEAELLTPDGRQVAAITWTRRATIVGTDNPSLSRIGDALQFAEPFADAAAAAMTAKGRPTATPRPDPCAAYGPRVRPEGWFARFVTGLYVPQMSGASRQGEPQP